MIQMYKGNLLFSQQENSFYLYEYRSKGLWSRLFESEIKGDIAHKMNSLLPKDIVVYKVFKVDDEKHARFDAVSRSYEYKIWLGRNPFLSDYSWQIHSQKLDVELMNDAAKLLLEYTDFQTFSKVKTDVYTYNCNVTEAIWKKNENELIFYITANRFLRNMVRAIVGTLLDVGLEKISISDFKNIIKSKNSTARS